METTLEVLPAEAASCEAERRALVLADGSPSLHNAYHRLIVRTGDLAALYGALAGLELAFHRDTLAHGDWQPWVEENCEFSLRTATNYLQAGDRAMEYVREKLGPQATPYDAISFLQGMVDSQLADPERAALLEAIRKPKAAALPAKKKRKSAPRGPLAPEKIAFRYVSSVRKAAPEVRVVIFTELREDFEAWLQSGGGATANAANAAKKLAQAEEGEIV